MNVTYSPTADIGLFSEIIAWKVRFFIPTKGLRSIAIINGASRS
ncbi:hypothetical protein A4U53_035225 (plasmid) [Rhizobium ruizarguesonis]|uniref:Uncharacterized protein n=1 Tax=Rhizobium ruizarguesonis TaxID=2081791 RepID=A0ACD5EV39_9HYPH|nr:hypothetical protein [Rhizobium leguminosarum]